MDNSRPDLSQLIPPLPTNTQGIRRLLSAYRSGTAEIQSLLSQECNVILECKICQNMFRSLPNFISHKRAYCLRPAPPLEKILHNNELPEYFSKIEAIENELGRRDIDQIASRLTKNAAFAGSDGIRGENPEASQNIAYYTAIADSIKNRRSARIEQTTVLAPLPGTSKAVSQVVEVDLSDDEDDAPNKKKAKKGDDKPSTATSTGKNVNKNNSKSPSNSQAKGEKKKEGTYKVMQYPCPVCKKVFSKPNGTYRHIRDIHKKNNDQLERMKSSIRKKAFLVTVNKPPAKDQISPAATTNNNSLPSARVPHMVQESNQLSKSQKEEEKEWNDHTFTVDVGDHRCAHCGTRYERRAALLAHAKQCVKRAKDVKKPDIKTNTKSRGAANRKMSAPMKIVRKYLLNGPKSDEDRTKITNGVKSLRRSTRSTAPADCTEDQEEMDMNPTVPLTRLRIDSGDKAVVKSKSPVKIEPPKPPVPTPIQSPSLIESIIKNQKTSVSNILVRQVSDKSCLSPLKSPTPIKEPPAVASITPMLSVKPKDGYPLNYFSPGSAETKLGGNSVPSSIQIRRDYTKSSNPGDDSADLSSVAAASPERKETCKEACIQTARPVISTEEVPKSRPVLNFEKSMTALEVKKQLSGSEMRNELVEVVKKFCEEKKATEPELKLDSGMKTETVALPETKKPTLLKCIPVSSSQIVIAANAEGPIPAVQTPLINAQQLKTTTIVAVPVASWDKLPSITSAIKLKLPSGFSKVVLTNNNAAVTSSASADTPKVTNYEAAKQVILTTACNQKNDESKSASDDEVTIISSNVPEVPKLVPVGDLFKSKTAGLTHLPIRFLPKSAIIAPPSLGSKKNSPWTSPESDSSRVSDSVQKSLEENGFRGWSKKHPQKSLALHNASVFYKFHDHFTEFVRKIEDVNIVIELDPSVQPVELPDNVKIEYLKN